MRPRSVVLREDIQHDLRLTSQEWRWNFDWGIMTMLNFDMSDPAVAIEITAAGALGQIATLVFLNQAAISRIPQP
jgi:hypothetical protein